MNTPLVLLLVGMGPWAATVTAQGPQAGATASTPANSEEDALIRHGIELRKARDDLSARVEFQKAYDLTHSPRAAAQLGLAEFALGRFDDAEAHVSESLRTPRDPWINKYKKELDQSLADIKTHVARVEVIGEPPNAELYVNGRLAGRLPLSNPVAVSEGQVDIELRAPGFVRGGRTVTLAGGQYQRMMIRLEPDRRPASEAAAAGPVGSGSGAGAGVEGLSSASMAVATAAAPGATVASAHPEPTPSATRRVVQWTSLGLAGASLATGVAAGAISISNTSTFGKLNGGRCQDNGGRAFDSVKHVLAPECQPSLDAARTARSWEIAAFVGAGVFATTWLILALTEPASTGATASNRADAGTRVAWWACVPTLSGAAGATCALKF
jgi:hypothetical protein